MAILPQPLRTGFDMKWLLTCILFLSAAVPVFAQPPDQVPAALQNIGLDDHLGRKIPLDLQFANEQGETVRIGDYFTEGSRKPVLIVPVYYGCTSLCNFTLNGLVDVMKELKYTPGREFEIVTVSFDPTEKSALAAAKKLNYIQEYGRPEAAQGWHWLTGEKSEIAQLMDALGFRYVYDARTMEYNHAPATYILTPDGVISRYFSSIYFEPADLRLAIVEASNGAVGSVMDKFILFCSHFDPTTGKYTTTVMRIVQVFGTLTALLLGGMIAGMILLDRRRMRRRAASQPPTATGAHPLSPDATRPLREPAKHSEKGPAHA